MITGQKRRQWSKVSGVQYKSWQARIYNQHYI